MAFKTPILHKHKKSTKSTLFVEKENQMINYNTVQEIYTRNFGSETLNVCGEKEECDGYNEARPNMNGCAYSFFVPLTGNNKLQCFTESSFEKLKSKLMKILIKDEVASN